MSTQSCDRCTTLDLELSRLKEIVTELEIKTKNQLLELMKLQAEMNLSEFVRDHNEAHEQ